MDSTNQVLTMVWVQLLLLLLETPLNVIIVYYLDIQWKALLDSPGAGHGTRSSSWNWSETSSAGTYGESFGEIDYSWAMPTVVLQYLLMNLGMSTNFGPVDLINLPFPAHMRVDYIRVYQPEDEINIGCNPKDFPTEDYINQWVRFSR